MHPRNTNKQKQKKETNNVTKNGSQKKTKKNKAKGQTTHKQTQTKQKPNNADETYTYQFLDCLNPRNIIFVLSVSFNSFHFNTHK